MEPEWERLAIPTTAIPFFLAISIAFSIPTLATVKPIPLSPSRIPEHGPVSFQVMFGSTVIPPFAILSL